MSILQAETKTKSIQIVSIAHIQILAICCRKCSDLQSPARVSPSEFVQFSRDSKQAVWSMKSDWLEAWLQHDNMRLFWQFFESMCVEAWRLQRSKWSSTQQKLPSKSNEHICWIHWFSQDISGCYRRTVFGICKESASKWASTQSELGVELSLIAALFYLIFDRRSKEGLRN